MENFHKPLLGSRERNHRACKILCVAVVLVAFVSVLALVALNVISVSPSHFLLSPHICKQTLDTSSCLAAFFNASLAGILHPTPVRLLRHVLGESLFQVDQAIKKADAIAHRIDKQEQRAALVDCQELLDLSRDRLLNSHSALKSLNAQSHADVLAWLSGVLTNHVTCIDGLEGEAKQAMGETLQICMSLASTSLAVLKSNFPSASQAMGTMDEEFPAWVSARDRKLLEASPNAWKFPETSPNGVKADVVVANDGSGKYKTIGEAIASAPDNGKSRYVIYVKAGTYKEKVEVGKKKKNVMIVGDGMDSTIITGSLNVVDGSTTFNSATVAAVGDGFMAQDIWFQNTAGPGKHQAVALRVGADQSVINRCRIDGYQDTLYTHSLRQFYRDCYITGTVDFIFGNAAVVFQNCDLVARKPMSNQQNLVTAQGRTDPNQNTGISIQKCRIVPSSDLKPVIATIPTYLGRPWKEYSRTVYMQSYIESHVSPAGWLPWSGDFGLKTLYYGEYANSGPGAGTGNRVKWPGYHVITDPNVAQQFTVAGLIQGGAWLQSTGVTFTEGL